MEEIISGGWEQSFCSFVAKILYYKTLSALFPKAISGERIIVVELLLCSGCMGYAMRQYRNLCASCHESWLELNDPDFHEDESANGDNEAANSKCKKGDCANVGEAQYHGFCHTCFHSTNF